jgi:guanosine-3',5'-bis(diphosphate) 3'-pyrophosphohydrolase
MNQSFDSDAFPMFVRALAFAAHKHSNHRRKDVDASPYINHPIALVSILVDEAGIDDVDVLCGALLHDVLEDTETTAGELTEIFGDTVAGIVIEVTDDKSLAKEERKRLQIEHAPRLSPAARLVKVADKIANLRDVADNPPANWSLARRHEYFEWAKAVVDAIPDVPPTLRKLFDDVYARRPTIGELSKALGFTENKQPGIGFIITGVQPPQARKEPSDTDHDKTRSKRR